MLLKLGLPLRDLVGVHIKLLRQLHQRLVAAQGCHRHLRLERRCVIPAGPLHRLLLLGSASRRPLVEQRFHLRYCPINRGRLSRRLFPKRAKFLRIRDGHEVGHRDVVLKYQRGALHQGS